LRATDSIIENTNKGTRVFNCDWLCNEESHAKIKYVGEFLRYKIHSLTLQREKKEHILHVTGGHTDHGSIFVVNECLVSIGYVTNE